MKNKKISKKDLSAGCNPVLFYQCTIYNAEDTIALGITYDKESIKMLGEIFQANVAAVPYTLTMLGMEELYRRIN